MRVRKLSIFCVAIVLCFSAFLLACSGGGGDVGNVKITISYFANGGLGEPYTQEVSVGDSVQLLPNAFTHTYKYFSGWNTASNGTGESFANEATFLGIFSTTLYAQWSETPTDTDPDPNEPDPNDPSNPDNPPEEPDEEEGFSFVMFHANLGSGTMTAQKIAENTSAELVSNTFARKGYTFSGWNTNADGSGVGYANGATIHITSENTTLYAQWTANSYTITFDPNTGSGTAQTVSVSFDETITLKGNIFSKADFKFEGWNTKADGSGTVYAASASYKHKEDKNITFYAYWISLSAPVAPTILDAGGMFESAFVEFGKVDNTKGYKVYAKDTFNSSAEFVQIDNELIRDYGTYMRADVLGLAQGDYSIKVVAVSSADVDSQPAFINNLAVMAYERTGFAFALNSPNKTSSGAYNDDGTLKEGAKVVYVTEQNKNTVSLEVVTDVGKNKSEVGVGLAAILKLREKSSGETTPLAIRIIGEVVQPADVDSLELISVKKTANVTWEGVGEDALMRAWGINVRESNNVEIRNLAFTGFKDDSVSVQKDNRNIWIHHNDFMIGADGGGDKDKGDGSSDIKQNSSFVTISYNHYIDTGKSMLVGQGDSAEFFVTINNNFFDQSGSRHPRVRHGSVHVYNNYYKSVTVYGVGAAMYSSILVEGNYFENTHRPMIISGQGRDVGSDGKGTMSNEAPGAIKEQNNYFDAKSLSTYTKGVDSGLDNSNKNGSHKYNNFDNNLQYSYTVDSPEIAKEKTVMYAGRMQKYVQDDSLLLEQFIDAVEDIGTVEYSSESQSKIALAKTKYDNIADKDIVPSQYVTMLNNAISAYNTKASASISGRISAIDVGSLTASDLSALLQLKAEYDSSSEAIKALVENYSVLTSAISAINAQAVAYINTAISGLPAVASITFANANNSELIDKLSEIEYLYNELSSQQQSQVVGYATTYAAVIARVAYVNAPFNVNEAIEEFILELGAGSVTVDHAAELNSLKALLDALDAEQKAYVALANSLLQLLEDLAEVTPNTVFFSLYNSSKPKTVTYSDGGVSVTVNGNYNGSNALKIETATTIVVELPVDAQIWVEVDIANSKLKINSSASGTDYSEDGKHYVIFDCKAGTHTITKGEVAVAFSIAIVFAK